jgi:hypothetical protein
MPKQLNRVRYKLKTRKNQQINIGDTSKTVANNLM